MTRKLDWQRLLAPAVLVLLYVFFSIFGSNFFSVDYALSILSTSYFIGFMAIGVTFVIITGGIDLSIGAVMMCGALLGGFAYTQWHWPMWASLTLAVSIATMVGFINGLLIAFLKLPPFIATLGTMMMSMGGGAIATKVMTMRYPSFGEPGSLFKEIFYKTGNKFAIPSFPVGALWLLLAIALAWLLLNRTKFGRYTYAMGSNFEASRLSGINTRKWQTLVYTLCGFFSGFAGIFYSAVYTSIIPSTGNGLELLAIAGVVIGGTSMSGGSGSLIGTIIGVFVMSVLKMGLMSMGLQGQWQTFFTGAVVIGAVLLDRYRFSRAEQARQGDAMPAGEKKGMFSGWFRA